MEVEASAGTNPADGFTMRLDQRAEPARIHFDGRDRQLVRLSFYDAGYHHMNWLGPGHSESMLFANTANPDEFLIKPAQDDSFWYLARDYPVRTVTSRNWHYWLETRKLTIDAPFAGAIPSHDAVLRGELRLPQGVAIVDVDMLRSPVTEIGFTLLRERRRERFWQTNDSNTRELKACTRPGTGPPRCQVLFIAAMEERRGCRGTDTQRIAIWIDLANNWRHFTVDGKDQVRDRDCKIVYRIEHVDENKVIVKDLTGGTTTFSRPPR
jgi:hypothetical protein